jgi:N4-gp56 family major capsid protein
LATTTTATTNFSQTVTNLVARKILQNLRAQYAHAAPGNYRPEAFFDGTNGTFLWTTYADQAAQTTALTEGTSPTAQALSISTESAAASQYGGVFEATDLAMLQSPHNLLAVGSDHAADQAAKTIDTVVRDIIVAGTSVLYAGTATSRATVAVSHVLTGALVKRLAEELNAGNVRPFSNGRYRAIIHPRQAGDLQRDTSTAGYTDIFKANEMASTLTELATAAYAGVDFLITSQAKSFTTAGAASANVYAGLFFGQEAYGIGWEQPLNAYLVPPGGDHSDPLAQKAALGWKTALAAKLFTGPGAQLIRLETGATYG